MRTRLMAAALAAALLLPAAAGPALAQDPYLAAYYYVECMDAAEEDRDDCLDHADLEELCWSAFGYAKLWCTIKYGRDLLRKRV